MISPLAVLALLAAAALPVTASAAPPAQASMPSASASPAPSPPSDDALMARAKEWLGRIQTGNVDRTQFDARLNAELTPGVLRQMAGLVGRLGQPSAFSLAGIEDVDGGFTAYVYTVTFRSGVWNEIFQLDSDGKISGLNFSPAP
ncbi:MAG TPA: hypothetical protein VIN40_06955 [Candidatus Tyrphobacter sp.]